MLKSKVRLMVKKWGSKLGFPGRLFLFLMEIFFKMKAKNVCVLTTALWWMSA